MTKTLRSFALPVLLVLALCAFTGCPKSQPGAPQDQYMKAAIAAQDFADSLDAFTDTAITLHDNGIIGDDEHRVLMTISLQGSVASKELKRAIGLARSNPDAWTAANAALDSLTRLDSEGILRIKSPDARAKLTLALTSARTALAAVRAALPPPPPPPVPPVQKAEMDAALITTIGLIIQLLAGLYRKISANHSGVPTLEELLSTKTEDGIAAKAKAELEKLDKK